MNSTPAPGPTATCCWRPSATEGGGPAPCTPRRPSGALDRGRRATRLCPEDAAEHARQEGARRRQLGVARLQEERRLGSCQGCPQHVERVAALGGHDGPRAEVGL